MPRPCLLALVALLPLASGATALPELLADHARTLGTPGYRSSIDSLTYALRIQEPTYAADAVYRVTRSGQMRIDVYIDGSRVFTEARDDREAWQWHPGIEEPELIDAQAAAALRHGVELPGHIFTLLDMPARGHSLQLLESADVPDRLGLKVTLDDGHQKFFQIDRATGLIVASSDHRAFHPDWDSTEVQIETRYSDFREVGDGWQKSFAQENWDRTNEKWLGTTEVRCLRTNLEVSDALFSAAAFREALPVPTCAPDR